MKTKVIKIYETGSVDVLKIEEIEIGKPSSNEVLIEHSYAGLNFIDINQRRGSYPLKKLPQIMGMEASGIIKEVGQNVSKFKIGDKVTHCMNLGSYSKLMILNQEKVIRLKNDVNLNIAAASTLQGLTAQYLINQSYKLKPNDTVLIHAVAGGVGQILCQWAKNIGAYVIGTVSNPNKEKIAKINGCDFIINYSENSFDEKILEITEKKGVDVIYDSVGKDTFFKGIKCLAPKGRIVSFGVSSGPIDPININLLRSFSGSIATGGLNTYIKDTNEMQNNADTFFDLILKKEINIDITNEFYIDEIQKAQLSLEKRKTTGSVILKF